MYTYKIQEKLWILSYSVCSYLQWQNLSTCKDIFPLRRERIASLILFVWISLPFCKAVMGGTDAMC